MVDVKFQGEMKWKVIQGLELSALGAVRYQTSSQEHNVLDDANQAIAYRTGMDDATIREQNKLLYTDPDNPYALPITLLPEGGIYQRQTAVCWDSISVEHSHGIIFSPKSTSPTSLPEWK